MAKNNPVAEDLTAPVQEFVSYEPVPTPTRAFTIERQGLKSEPYVRRLPQVRGGVCEHCGVIDPNVPSQYQYRMCEHYRGMALRCSYCDDIKDPDDVVAHAKLNVAEHPDRPGTLIVWCDSYECSRKHEQRFRRNA